MHLSWKQYILPALVIVCVLAGWQGICTIPGDNVRVVTPVDTGISEVTGPECLVLESYLSSENIAEQSLWETDAPTLWLAPYIAGMQALTVAADRPAVIVAVLDTGIDKHHEDLNGAVLAEINFTDSPTADDICGHGTHVAGIIAAGNDNGIGIDGIAPDCRLINVKVADDRGRCRLSEMAEGIVWAVDNGALVLNISIEMEESSEILQEAIDYAWESGAVIIAAAGNGGSSLPVYPAGYDNCISVTAFKDDGELAPLANYGDWVDAAAPGYNIYSTLPDDDYGCKHGTSFATAYISGLSALLIPVMEDTNGNGRGNDEVRQAIEELCANNFGNDATL